MTTDTTTTARLEAPIVKEAEGKYLYLKDIPDGAHVQVWVKAPPFALKDIVELNVKVGASVIQETVTVENLPHVLEFKVGKDKLEQHVNSQALFSYRVNGTSESPPLELEIR
ncbi:hypothetical protein [Pseudomonas sp. RT6P73]